MHRKDFDKFYNSYLDPIYRFIFFRTGGNVEIAEDLTSDVFMKALVNIDKLDSKQNPGAWLYTVARNMLKNYYRDKKQNVDIDNLSNALKGEDGRGLFAQISDNTVLASGLEHLSPENRKIIQMKHLEGFSYKDIAITLKKTPGAVRVQAMRAMRELKLLIKA